jgi:hypothetical protein
MEWIFDSAEKAAPSVDGYNSMRFFAVDVHAGRVEPGFKQNRYSNAVKENESRVISKNYD